MIVIFAKQLIKQMGAERVRHVPTETGGFLVGLRRGLSIEVTDVTTQSQLDVATRSSFYRADPAHRAAILKAWVSSAKTKCLIGDWHTHPNGSANPSRSDLEAWRVLERSCRQPVVGLIDSGGTRPTVFAACSQFKKFATQMQVVEECRDFLTYACDNAIDANRAGVAFGQKH